MIRLNGRAYTHDEIKDMVAKLSVEDANVVVSAVDAYVKTPEYSVLPHFRTQLDRSAEQPNVEFLCCSRGAGKSELVRQIIEMLIIKGQDSPEMGYAHIPGCRLGVMLPTWNDAIRIQFDPLAARFDQLGVLAGANRSTGVIRLTDESGGGTIFIYGADKPGAARGSDLHVSVADELAAFRMFQGSYESYENLRLATRASIPDGRTPFSIVATTPQISPALRQIMEHDKTRVSRALISQNPYVTDAAREAMESLYIPGSVKYRLEILAEIVTEVDGSLFQSAWFIPSNGDRETDKRIITVDPNFRGNGANGAGDMAGIVVVDCERSSNVCTIRQDGSVHGGPEEMFAQLQKMVAAWNPDVVVMEGNAVRDYMKLLLKANPLGCGVQFIDATRSKESRLEFPALHASKGLLEVDPGCEDLIEEAITWLPTSPKSPNRLDALAIAVTHLVAGRHSYNKSSVASVATQGALDHTPSESKPKSKVSGIWRPGMPAKPR